MLNFLNKVVSVGVITAMNPGGKELSAQENHALNDKLLVDLHQLSCDPQPCSMMKMQGFYNGNPEENFLVTNIKRRDIVSLAEKYKQNAVVWGCDRSKEHFFFEYIERGKTKETKLIPYSEEDLQKSNFFNVVREGKFKIPFFEEKPDKIKNSHPPKIELPAEPEHSWDESFIAWVKRNKS